MAWKPLINDPFYSLNIFKDASEEINFSKWEKAEYQNLLDRANQATNEQQKKLIQQQAEALLMQEMPVMPLFYDETLQLGRILRDKCERF